MAAGITLSEDYESIILPPGGGKIFIVLGALSWLDRRGHLDNVTSWVGCSAGAIVSLYKVMGYSIIDIIEKTKDVNIFGSINLQLAEIKEKKGLIAHEVLREPIYDAMIDKCGSELTLSELYELTGLNLTIVTVRLDRNNNESQKTIYLNHVSHPDLSAITAVIMSSNIPGVFQQLEYDGFYYIDGAFGNPFPINIDYNKKRLAFYIITEVDPENSFSWYTSSVLYASLNEIRNIYIRMCSENCTIVKLVCPSLALNGMVLDSTSKGMLLGVGYSTMEQISSSKKKKSLKSNES